MRILSFNENWMNYKTLLCEQIGGGEGMGYIIFTGVRCECEDTFIHGKLYELQDNICKFEDGHSSVRRWGGVIIIYHLCILSPVYCIKCIIMCHVQSCKCVNKMVSIMI